MRACEGCRRRKIKCDAATTNSWPCASCVRLKLQCVPPSLNYDRAHGGGGSFSGLEGVLDFDHSSASGEDEHYGSYGDASQFYDFGDTTTSVQAPQATYGHDLGSFATPANVERHQNPQEFSYNAVTSMPMTLPESYQHPTAFQPIEQVPPQPSPDNTTWTQDQCSPADLSEVMGELSIKENGVGTSNSAASRRGSLLTSTKRRTYRSRSRVSLKRRLSKNLRSSFRLASRVLDRLSGFRQI